MPTPLSLPLVLLLFFGVCNGTAHAVCHMDTMSHTPCTLSPAHRYKVRLGIFDYDGMLVTGTSDFFYIGEGRHAQWPLLQGTPRGRSGSGLAILHPAG